MQTARSEQFELIPASGLFNDSCFFEKHIDVAEIQRNCPNGIVEGSQESIPQETHGVGGKRRGTKVMALRKGYSTKVDILLNILACLSLRTIHD